MMSLAMVQIRITAMLKTLIFDSQDTDLSDTDNQDAENQHQEETHLEKPHDYIITKEEKSKKEVSGDKVSIDQSVSAHKTAVENSADDGQMDGYIREKEIYTEVVKSNIEYQDYAFRAMDSDGYMTVPQLGE